MATAPTSPAANTTLPPPRRTGQTASDLLMQLRWFNDFYDQMIKVLDIPGAIQTLTASGVLEAPAGWFDTITKQLTDLTASTSSLNEATSSLNEAVTGLIAAVNTLNTSVSNLNTRADDLTTTVNDLSTSVEGLITTTTDQGVALTNQESALTLSGIFPLVETPGANNTAIHLLLNNNAGVNAPRVTLSVPDGGGAGFRALLVPN